MYELMKALRLAQQRASFGSALVVQPGADPAEPCEENILAAFQSQLIAEQLGAKHG